MKLQKMSIEIFSRKEKKMELTLRKGIIGSFLAGVLLMGAAVAAQPQVAYADDGRDSAPQRWLLQKSSHGQQRTLRSILPCQEMERMALRDALRIMPLHLTWV